MGCLHCGQRLNLLCLSASPKVFVMEEVLAHGSLSSVWDPGCVPSFSGAQLLCVTDVKVGQEGFYHASKCPHQGGCRGQLPGAFLVKAGTAGWQAGPMSSGGASSSNKLNLCLRVSVDKQTALFRVQIAFGDAWIRLAEREGGSWSCGHGLCLDRSASLLACLPARSWQESPWSPSQSIAGWPPGPA